MRIQDELSQYDRLIDVSGLELSPDDYAELEDVDEELEADDHEAELRRARLWH